MSKIWFENGVPAVADEFRNVYIKERGEVECVGQLEHTVGDGGIVLRWRHTGGFPIDDVNEMRTQ